MKKQASNAEIEDVLSSIRRLVSEDTRDSAGEGTFARVDQNALVLTPQQRVSEEATPDEGPRAPMRLGAPLSVPDAEGDEASTVEAQGLDPAGTEDEIQLQDADADEVGEAHAPVGGPDAKFSGAADADARPSDPPDADMSSLIAELSDAAEADDDRGHVAETDVRGGRDEAEEDVNAAALHALHGHDSHDTASHALEDKIAELEAMISQVEDMQEVVSQRPEGDTIAGPWPARPNPQVPAVDEERLRAIVAEVVREELQGALGERITRNVRKLVRREIQRILAAQDFD